MHITQVLIENFRALENIAIDFDTRVGVIVGPNAAGKSTVLEAIRFAKAVIAPRTPSEAVQVLNALGASSPHIVGRFRMDSIARDSSRDLRIKISFRLSAAELTVLPSLTSELARASVQAQMGQPFASADNLIALLSSDQGKDMTNKAHVAVGKVLDFVSRTGLIHLELFFDKTGQGSSRGNSIDAQIAAILERRLPPYKTGFMYFPADRALPMGEQAVQLGSADAQQQMESYNSQPQLKFARLKNTIFSAALLKAEGSEDADDIRIEFAKIFNGILKGRTLGDLGINQIGALGVSICDAESLRNFDIDAMSSGEKGLILTCLLIARSVVNDGIVLLDEPELHLNPAVCKALLSFLIEQYVRPRNLQMIVCSHSPEILSGAFESEDCSLYHLVSPVDISRVSQGREEDLDEAFRRLGANKSDSLLYRGLIYVEGVDDAALLDAGFPLQFRKYKIKPTHGRKEIEKAVELLQKQEQESGILVGARNFFLLDNDGKATYLKDSASVKVMQWDRYCLENFLVDVEFLSALMTDDDYFVRPLKTTGEAATYLKKTALGQLDMLAAKQVYEREPFEGLGIRQADMKSLSVASLSEILGERIDALKGRLENFRKMEWQARFLSEANTARQQLQDSWEADWTKECNGKILLESICGSLEARGGSKQFKIRAMKEANRLQSPLWRVADAKIREWLARS